MKIVPILLAAGSSKRLGSPKPLAIFGKKTALEIALENCAGLERPVVVLGCDAAKIRPFLPRCARIVVNRRWRTGQLSSLLCALKRIPPRSAFLLYPVDQPLLRRHTLQRLVEAFRTRQKHEEIVVPRHRGVQGHPLIVSARVRKEFWRAKTAREVIYREPQRLREIEVRTSSILEDFDTPETYRACLRKFLARR